MKSVLECYGVLFWFERNQIKLEDLYDRFDYIPTSIITYNYMYITVFPISML